MADAPALSPLIQRLAVGRLAAPGVLDRRELQRTPERFVHRSSTAMVGRLFRRVESATSSTADLPLVGSERAAELHASSAHVDAEMPTAGVASDDRDTTAVRRAAGAAGSFAAPSTATSAATSHAATTFAATSHAAARLQRAHGEAHASDPIAHDSATVPRAIDVAGTPVVAGRAPSAGSGSPTLMRKAESTAGLPAAALTRAMNAESRVVGMPTAPAASSDARVTLPVIARAPIALQRQAAEPIVRLIGGRAQSAFSPLATAHTGSSLPATQITGASTALLLRKSETTASTAERPSAATSAPSASAPPQSTSDAKESERAMQCFGDPEIDRIADQVESRLARRLEVERERLGVRPWRPGN